eukprot:scaffold233064_cov33-Tisochrysis_lutea.AAC.2
MRRGESVDKGAAPGRLHRIEYRVGAIGIGARSTARPSNLQLQLQLQRHAVTQVRRCLANLARRFNKNQTIARARAIYDYESREPLLAHYTWPIVNSN